MTKFITAKKIDYHSSPYGFITTIPQGTEVVPTNNLPDQDGNPRYWATEWQGMNAKAKSWHSNYGFLIAHDEVIET